MAFDITSKANQPILKYMKESKALILDPASGSRTTIRKLLSAMGVPTANVESLDLVDEAIEKMATFIPNIIITEMDLYGRSGFELLELQKKLLPDTSRTIFILLSSKNSPLITSVAAESDADGLVIKPINYASVENKLVEVATAKCFPSPYHQKIESAKLKITEKKLDEASAILTDIVKQDAKAASAHFYLGLIFGEQGKSEQAKQSYESGLKSIPNHYRSLMGLFDIYFMEKDFKKAYETGLLIAKHHVIPPRRIPDFIRVSVQNHKFEEIVNLYDIVMSIEEPDDIVVTYVGAALVLCGKLYLRQNEKDKALDILKKAQGIAKSKEKIQVEIISTLYRAGFDSDADALLAKMSQAVRYCSEMRIVEMERMAVLGLINEMMTLGMTLLRQDVKISRLYELMIEESKKIKRPIYSVDMIYSKAVSLMPDKTAFFEGLVSEYNKSAGKTDSDKPSA